jgi:argininosuccinate lyase
MSRFADPQDPRFRAINTSIGFDRRLAPHDLDGSMAHARMLARVGILTDDELAELERGLAQVRAEVDEGSFDVKEEDEDIHMAVERRLTEIVGPVGGKLHTARSRNDQVATDVALFVHERAHVARKMICELMGLLAKRAEEHMDWPMPGYTHLQRAQPVYVSHHLMAHFWRLRRDAQRFEFCAHQAQVMPLGSGALAGVNFETDRDGIAEELGFTSVAPNSLDAVSNRDFVLDYLSAAAICGTHLSQLGAELVLWSSEEFGFAEVPDAFASGSSIMPQKKNPDAAELLRGKAPRIVGHLTAMHGVLHALPLAYNKDLQEDKEHLFDTVDTIELALNAASGMVEGVRFDRDRLAQAASDEMLAATDVADLLVKRGMPFRQAHGVVAGLVRHSIERGVALSELTEDELAELAPSLDAAYYEVLAQANWLESKVSEGGTALERVREQLAYAREVLDQQSSLTR